MDSQREEKPALIAGVVLDIGEDKAIIISLDLARQLQRELGDLFEPGGSRPGETRDGGRQEDWHAYHPGSVSSTYDNKKRGGCNECR